MLRLKNLTRNLSESYHSFTRRSKYKNTLEQQSLVKMALTEDPSLQIDGFIEDSNGETEF